MLADEDRPLSPRLRQLVDELRAEWRNLDARIEALNGEFIELARNLYEAACVILTRSSAESTLRDWDIKLRERVGFKRAAVTVARKLSVVMHAMLKSGELFDKTADARA